MILKMDFSSSDPLYMQIRNQIVISIGTGELKPGEKLPTIRALADDTGINMMTVSKAYQLLKQEGYIETDRRKGAIVAQSKPLAVSEATMRALRVSVSELRAAGMNKEDIMALCAKIYEEGDVK